MERGVRPPRRLKKAQGWRQEEDKNAPGNTRHRWPRPRPPDGVPSIMGGPGGTGRGKEGVIYATRADGWAPAWRGH